jgi:hypothetical protein
MMIDELDRRLMLSSAHKDILTEWKTWLVLFQDVARRELTGQTLTDLEYQRLTDYGTVIASLTKAALDGANRGDDPEAQIDYNIAAITSVADTQDAQIIEAIGWVDEIYVVVERGQRQYLARGGVYSHYEFEWPLEAVLANNAWIQMLTEEQAPPRPVWVTEFVIP